MCNNIKIRDIENFKGYGVTMDGRVWSYHTNTFLNPRPLPNKYLRVYMRDSRDNKRKDRYVHRLVAQAFLSNPLNKKVVHHKDGNRTNNHMDNLEWVTHTENNAYTLKEGNTIRCKDTGRFMSGL